MRVNITIPTYNRARCLKNAVRAALDQSYEDTTVTVVDDGSTDHTRELLRPFFLDPKFCYIRLAENRGTAGAKNASILLSKYDAITFHDSDDIPSQHKIIKQQRALAIQGHVADAINDWEALGHRVGSNLEVDVVFTGHRLIKSNGTEYLIDKHVSLVDDFFPHVQFPSQTPGDWILVNSALFRASVFDRFGGYLESIEEDRELRNRLLAAGVITYFLKEPLMDKIEMGDSLTVAESTNYQAEWRQEDRREVWERTRLYRRRLLGDGADRPSLSDLIVPIDLQVEVAEISNPDLVELRTDVPMTQATRDCFQQFSRSKVSA